MSTMHQPMQQRAGEQQKVGQNTEQMCPVLRDQEKSNYGHETKHYQAAP
jgi:hypothetical protein